MENDDWNTFSWVVSPGRGLGWNGVLLTTDAYRGMKASDPLLNSMQRHEKIRTPLAAFGNFILFAKKVG